MAGCSVLRWGLGVSATVLLVVSCSTSDVQKAKSAQETQFLPLTCAPDQLREFSCDGLLPMSTALGAPPPYENCPAGIESQAGVYPTRQRVARFDSAHTEWARQRVKPGHTCCYSWCADVDVREPSEVAEPESCNRVGEELEHYCMAELEAGTSQPADAPFERCPAAIRPPESLHFYVPRAAPIDYPGTQAARARGGAVCCYAWCSKVPLGIFPDKR